MLNKKRIVLIAALALLFTFLSSASVKVVEGENEQKLSPREFQSPPKNYLPKTWMHSMNGNLSKPGFTEDFKAMKEGGIGGAIFFTCTDVINHTPPEDRFALAAKNFTTR